jgi:hypothetical protein
MFSPMCRICAGGLRVDRVHIYAVGDPQSADYDPELIDMVSIGRAIQWTEQLEFIDWCREMPERARFYGYLT